MDTLAIRFGMIGVRVQVPILPIKHFLAAFNELKLISSQLTPLNRHPQPTLLFRSFLRATLVIIGVGVDVTDNRPAACNVNSSQCHAGRFLNFITHIVFAGRPAGIEAGNKLCLPFIPTCHIALPACVFRPFELKAFFRLASIWRSLDILSLGDKLQV